MRTLIHIGGKNVSVNDALDLITDDWIAGGNFCEDTVASLRDALQEAQAKLSERKTVHGWLNEIDVARHENGRPLCLLRRLRILCSAVAKAEAVIAKPEDRSV